MSEIPNFWLLALISQMSPYLKFILVSKSTYPLNIWCFLHKTHNTFTYPPHYNNLCVLPVYFGSSQNSSEQSCDRVLFHSISVPKIWSTPNRLSLQAARPKKHQLRTLFGSIDFILEFIFNFGSFLLNSAQESSMLASIVSMSVFRAVARHDNWAGGGCIFIYSCLHTVKTIDFKRNPSGRTQIYVYTAPPPPIWTFHLLNKI
jgi:hypothetical protein